MSPGSERFKNNIKAPLVFLCLTCGLMNGTSLVLVKVGGEGYRIAEEGESVVFPIIMGFIGIQCAGFQMLCLNIAMKYYNNLDVQPIYQALILVFVMVSGMVCLDESALYTWGEISLLGGSCLLVLLGIYILTQKQNEFKEMEGKQVSSTKDSEMRPSHDL